jgi:hypothetical protein
MNCSTHHTARIPTSCTGEVESHALRIPPSSVRKPLMSARGAFLLGGKYLATTGAQADREFASGRKRTEATNTDFTRG